MQEVHGTKEEIACSLFMWHKDWDLHVSAGAKRRTAGSVTMVRKGTFVNGTTVTPTIHHPGRLIELNAAHNEELFTIWNVHNFDIPPAIVAAVADKINQQHSEAQAKPLEHCVFVTGDFNFPARGETSQSLLNPTSTEGGFAQCCPGHPTQLRWERALGSLVEFEQPNNTHFWPTSSTCSRIDRTYGSMHGWILRNLDVCAYVVEDPKRMFDTGLSDHAPLVTTLALRAPAERQAIPISKVVAKSVAFQQYHDELWADIDVTLMGPTERWETHKTVIRMAADAARRRLFGENLNNMEVRALALSSIARAVWQNNVSLARRLIAQSPVAAAHIDVLLNRSGVGKVTLRNPLCFQKEVESCQREVLGERRTAELNQAEASRSAKTKGKCASKVSGITRLAKLWSPFDRRLVLTGIRTRTINKDAKSTDEAFDVVRGDRQIGAALAAGWENTFTKVKPIDCEMASRYLERWAVKYDFSGCTPPTSLSYQSFLDQVRHSATGPDGIPYAAWQNTNGQGAVTLFELGEEVACGYQPALTFNSATTLFIPKGDDKFDAEEITREADSTRPLTCKNCDNKTIGGVSNSTLRPAMKSNMVDVQRGFTPGRQIGQNIVDLDSGARAFGMTGEVSFSNPLGKFLCPLLAFFDYAAAFPSLSQQFMFLVLSFIGMPEGLYRVVEANYFFIATHTKIGQAAMFLFLVRCGVLQGCPLSGTLFALSAEPFLRHLKYEVQEKEGGMVRACADDVGIAITALKSLLGAQQVFERAESLAGLTLKPKKCQLVPVCSVATPELEANIKCWLARWIPSWSTFAIASSGKYLGLWLGTITADKQLTVARLKWRERAAAIAKTGCSGSVACHNYASRAVPVLGYIFQFVVMDEKTARHERFVLHHLLHLAQSAMAESVLHNISTMNGPKMPSLKVYSLAALSRAARSTLCNWRENYELLKVSAEAHVPGTAYVKGCVSPLCFDTPAIADTLRWAADGFKGTLFGLPANSFAYKLQPALSVASAEASRKIKLSQDPSKKIQRTFSESIRRRCLDADITCAVEAVVLKHFGVVMCVDRWPALKALLGETSSHFATVALKTWFNSWATTARYHDNRCTQCVFGCAGADDDLRHYVVCMRLWRTIKIAFRDLVPGTLEKRILVAESSRTDLHKLVVAFHTMQAIRMDHIDLVRSSARTRRFEELAQASLAVAKATVVRYSL